MRFATIALAAILVCACSTTPTPSGPPATPSPAESPVVSTPVSPDTDLALPEMSPGLEREPCAGLFTEGAVLRGDAADPRKAWLEWDPYGRVELVWPVGYRARFTPALEIVAPDGRIVARGDQSITGVCVPEGGGTQPVFLDLVQAR